MTRHDRTARAGSARTSLYDEITDKIMAELEGGRVPWAQPWGSAAAKAPLAMPKNAATGRQYSGINVLILWGGLAGLDQGGQAGTQDRHTAFLNGPVDRQIVAPDRITPPASPCILQAGSVIPAALITGIRSDLPGQITAQVTENVYDSPTGSLLLIPQGTRISGQYDDGVTFGQRRVLLVWNRLILPGGRSIVLER